MARKSDAAKDRIAKVPRIDALIAQGRPVAEALDLVGVAEATYAPWRPEIEANKSKQTRSRQSRLPRRAQQSAQESHNVTDSSDDLIPTPSTAVEEDAAVASPNDVSAEVALQGTLETSVISAHAEPVSLEAPSSTASAALATGSDDPAQNVAPEGPAAVVARYDDPSPNAKVVATRAAIAARGRDPIRGNALSAAPANLTRSDDPSKLQVSPEDAAAIQSKLEFLIRQEASSCSNAAEPGMSSPNVEGRPRRWRPRLWRSVALWALLAGAPAIAFAASIVMMDRARTAMEEALERGSTALVARLEQTGTAAEAAIQGLQQRGTAAEASIHRLQQRGAAAEAAIQRLQQRGAANETAIARQQQAADIARPQVDGLQQQAASNRAELARLNSEIATISKAPSPLLAQLDRQQADFVSRIEALRKNAESDRAQMLATLSQFPPATELENLKTDLIKELAKLRQEMSANGAGLNRLKGQFDSFKRASSQRQPRATELDTASIAPAGQARSDSELPPGPPASRSPLVATVPFEVVLPKAGSLPQATQNPEQPADGQTATVAPADPAADNAAPAQPTGRFPRGSLGCTRFKTYDAQTQTYRGRGGVVRPCRPL